jgi:hypothetical protein
VNRLTTKGKDYKTSSLKTVAQLQQQDAETPLEPEESEVKPVPEPRANSAIERKLDYERDHQWQNYGPVWYSLMNQMRKEKDQRRHELFLIDRRKNKLEEWRKRLEQMQYDLTTREGRIIESEPYLSLAKKLQEMKLTLEDALPWIETINEVAQIQNTDINHAAIFVAQEIRLYRQFGSLDKSVKQLEGELKMLNISITQKQPVITTLLKLKQNGVKDDDIIALSKIIDLSRMGREWTPFGPRTGMGMHQNPSMGQNPEQGNGNNGINPGSNNGGNGYGGNYSINDLIKLNLLKSSTTTMLNRMGIKN